MAHHIAPKTRNDFKVAIMCALPVEAEKVRDIFDRCWDDEGRQYSKVVGDQNAYTTGVIGRHNVVLVHMPGMGNNRASQVAANLRSSYPQIQLLLVVGICGVVPVHPQTKEEIVLGDIIISTAVTQYDFGRQYPESFHIKREVDNSLGQANPTISALINGLQIRQNRQRMSTNLAQLIQSDKFKEQVPASEYPGASQDWLYEASYVHQHRPLVDCITCYNNRETCSKSCRDLGCEEARRIVRNRHCHPKTEELAKLPDNLPVIHFGRFGSADTVMKSGKHRDNLSIADNLAAFEMEGAGVWEQHPTIVIKAACDYADSHKNKVWQAYAAAMAAACLKVFLKEWVIVDELVDSPWHVPFNKISGFVGRSDELNAVKTKMFDHDDSPLISFLGLGGVGKSRLALELAYWVKSELPQHSVFWVQAEKRLTFEDDILQIGKKLAVPGIDDAKADIKALVKQRLQNQEEKWLLILDNADDEMLWGRRPTPSQQEISLVNYLPRTPNGTIVVTTRSRLVATFLSGKDVIILRALSADEALKMFTNRLLGSRDMTVDQTALKMLLEKLTNLPLAITQASSFINKTECSIQDYLKLLDEPDDNIIELLSEDFGDQSRYPNALNPIATTWLISFQHIQENHPLAVAFLSSMACLHEKAIPLSLLPAASSKMKTIEAIGVLTGYSFVEKRASADGITDVEKLYDMHRLVQLAARSWLKMENKLVYEIEACTTRLVELFPTPNHENKSLWSMYLPHAQRLYESGGDSAEQYHLLEMIGSCFVVDGKYNEAVQALTMVANRIEKKLGTSDRQTLLSYNDLGQALNLNGNWSLAEKYFQRVLDGSKALFGAEHPDTLNSMGNLATTYSDQGRYTEAEELEVQVMEVRKRVLGVEHPDTLHSMGNLASTYSDQGRHIEAEELKVQVMEARKRLFGAEHPSTLTSISNLASTYWNQGRYTEAEELEVQVIEVKKKVLGAEHPNTLLSMSNLASTYSDQGRHIEAEELEVQVMEARKRVLGAEHPNTLLSMSNLALTYWNQGRYVQAEELGVQVIETSKRVLGAEHPHTLLSMSNLALTYSDQGRYIQAEELGVQVIEARKRALGVEHPDTLLSISNLAWTYLNQGRYTEAEELEVQVTEARKRVLGAEHPDTLKGISNLALTYWNQGRYIQAEELGVQVIETSKRVLGAEHPHTLLSMSNLALTYSDQGRYIEAEELGIQVLKTRKRVLGAEHPDTLLSISNLALVYSDQGRHIEAEELGVQVLETRKRVLGAEHPDTLLSMSNRALAYSGQGRYTEAEELGVQVIEIRKRVLGAEHPDVLTSMYNLAWTYMEQQRRHDALTLMRPCADLYLKVLGSSHPYTRRIITELQEWEED